VGKVSREFQVFVKPAGAVCNLDCQYCYYRDKRSLYPDTGVFRMPESLLEEYIVQHIEAAAGPEIAFSWHGGEPTTLGVDFFRKAVELQRKHRPAGWRIRNGIQTNGVLLDEEWCRFLAAEEFRAGLSLDGPAELHDPYRVTRGGQPTHQQAMRGYHLLRQHEVPTDIVCTVHNLNVRYPLTVYRFFREIGCRYLGFLPVVESAPEAPDGVGPYTPSAEAYGAFLCKIFDEWIERDTSRMAVQTFEEAARPALGMEHSLCVFRETCGQIPVVEHNGDFFRAITSSTANTAGATSARRLWGNCWKARRNGLSGRPSGTGCRVTAATAKRWPCAMADALSTASSGRRRAMRASTTSARG